jgi:hypothetical protein
MGSRQAYQHHTASMHIERDVKGYSLDLPLAEETMLKLME